MQHRYRPNRFFMTPLIAAVLSLAISSAALASAGCDAVNAGGFDASASGLSNAIKKKITDFGVGDTLNFTITFSGTYKTKENYWSLGGGSKSSNLSGRIYVLNETTPFSYTVKGGNDTALTEELVVNYAGDTVTVKATCP